MSIVALEHMSFFAYHGVYPKEQQQGNHFAVDLWMDTGDLPLPVADDLAEALDYGTAYQIVAEEMAVRCNLLETLCARIGARLLAWDMRLRSVRVRVSKADPPVGGPCASSYVEHEFRR
jgi:7,8-dihydroneopterin aldolase/epimerase/oxygenase